MTVSARIKCRTLYFCINASALVAVVDGEREMSDAVGVRYCEMGASRNCADSASEVDSFARCVENYKKEKKDWVRYGVEG